MLGLDIGNFSAVVAATGRAGTTVLPNRISNRETPALVAFDPAADERRTVGEAASTQSQSNPTGTIWCLKHFLGRTGSPQISAGTKARWLPFKLVEDPSSGGHALQLPHSADGRTVPVEAVLAPLLADCLRTAESAR